MADRRRKKHKKSLRGCLCMLAAVTGIGAATAWAVPWLAETGGLKMGLGRAVKEAAHLVSRQEGGFPELNIAVEEVEGDFYYQQLDESAKTIYRELLQGVNEMQKCILIHAGRNDDPGKAYEYLLYDRPELFWCDGSSKMTVYEEYTEFYPGYTCTEEERQNRESQINEEVEKCTKGIEHTASQYERIKYVYEYLVETVDYDENAPDNQNIYSALVGKKSVCAGYSRAAQYLLEHMGISSIYVVGTIKGQGAHAWNIVNCDSRYYQMDVTFGDPVFLSEESGENLPDSLINYDYLCCTDADIMTDHEQSTEVEYPVCESDDLNYYKRNGNFYESFDPQILLSAMNDSICAKEELFVCKFADKGSYEEARDVMINELFPRAAQNLAAMYGLPSAKYTYVEDKGHFRMMVFWNYGEN